MPGNIDVVDTRIRLGKEEGAFSGQKRGSPRGKTDSSSGD